MSVLDDYGWRPGMSDEKALTNCMRLLDAARGSLRRQKELRIEAEQRAGRKNVRALEQRVARLEADLAALQDALETSRALFKESTQRCHKALGRVARVVQAGRVSPQRALQEVTRLIQEDDEDRARFLKTMAVRSE